MNTEVNRRTFVRSAAAATLAASYSRILGANDRVRIGVVGLGGRGRSHGEAEPDERMRSFVIYLIGSIAGLLVILMFGSRLGSWTFVAPVVGFAAAALFDYFVPPAGYQPRDPHRYGASPPVTVR